ncbi:HoxN/HupN/NixA family nickel/cobalt transporter [Staphylococcus aureus]
MNYHFQDIGGTIGTLVSGFFLVLIGVLNLIILISLINLFAKLRREHMKKLKSMYYLNLEDLFLDL